MEEIKTLITEVLEKGYLMSLATVDESGPWVADVIYVHDDDLNVYWLSKSTTRHSLSIANDGRVAATVTVSNCRGEDNLGLQIQGRAEAIVGDDLALGVKHCVKREKPVPTELGEMLDEGDVWYCLKPLKIDLIYEPLYGFEKKFLEL